MVFKKREEGGEVDKNINTDGRKKTEKGLSRRALKERELMGLIRKIKPHLSESITIAAGIMKNKEAAHSNQLRACVILLDAYKELVSDVYAGEETEEATEIQQLPTFSLKMIS